LVPRDDGKPRCVACYMCATACPAQCIYIEAGEYDPADVSGESRVIEKFPTAFVIDELRCIVCGLCVEACPKDAIRMDTYTHTPSEYNRQGFVWDIPRLLQGKREAHASDPWNKRDASSAPGHQPKEAHTRVGAGDLSAHGSAGQKHHGLTVVTDDPVPITKFFKRPT
jgi:NADH-quinone oxidoreductase subunit I